MYYRANKMASENCCVGRLIPCTKNALNEANISAKADEGERGSVCFLDSDCGQISKG